MLSMILLALAVWMQDTTFIGLAGIGVWVVGTIVLSVVRGTTSRHSAWRAVSVVLVVMGLVILVATTLSDELVWAWWRYRTTPLFSAGLVDDFWFYHFRFVLFYPTLWPLTGLLAVFAALRNPRLAWLIITVFGIAFLLTSFAAQKAMRYFSYAQPLLAVLWGVGMGYVLPALWRHIEATRTRLADTMPLSSAIRAGASRTMVVAALAIVLLMNPFWLRTASIIGNVTMPQEQPTADWRAAREALAPWTAGADIMVTTDELGAIYFLGRSDIRYSPSKFEELPRDQRFEFGIDPRVGRPVIAKPESLERLIECFDSGFIVGPIKHWGSPILISKEVQDVLRRNASPIAVPRDSHLYAWGWRRAPEPHEGPGCVDLKRFSRVHR